MEVKVIFSQIVQIIEEVLDLDLIVKKVDLIHLKDQETDQEIISEGLLNKNQNLLIINLKQKDLDLKLLMDQENNNKIKKMVVAIKNKNNSDRKVEIINKKR